jgi:PAS domain S-box-containing protein
MNKGIAGKLLRNYLTIILSMIVAGVFCLYVLHMSQAGNEELVKNSLPSIDELKMMKGDMLELKKLSNSWAFAPNKRDKERLDLLVQNELPAIKIRLQLLSTQWKNNNEIDALKTIYAKYDSTIRALTTIVNILTTDYAVANEVAMEKVDALNSTVAKTISANDKQIAGLIAVKNQNLIHQQEHIAYLMGMLYIMLFCTMVLIITVSIISLRFSENKIVKPLLDLQQSILLMAQGEVLPVTVSKRNDEIGQIQNAISIMVEGVLEKIHFAENIGRGNYEQEFSLLSDHDKLGISLISMRNNLAKANKALLEQEHRLIEAQRIARIGNYYYKVNDQTYQSSETLDEILGIKDEKDKTMQNWVNLILPEFREYVFTTAINAIKENKVFSEQYKIHQYGTGKEIWIAVKGENNIDASGRVLSVFGTMQDITETKTLELELNNSYQIATEQNKRLSNFSYIVSHNLRMHAVNIQGLLKLYQQTNKEKDKAEIFDLLLTAGARLDETMHHLNEIIAMQGTLKVDVVSLNLQKHINNTLSALNVQISSKNAEIISHVGPNDTVNYNPAYLDSILLNLISNAIKYSHPARSPIVVIDFMPLPTANPNYSSILQVSDNGLGIDMKLNGHKLFGMYKTFHKNPDAKGLGLFLVKYQIDAMGGKIEVESEPNIGTTFKVYIK